MAESYYVDENGEVKSRKTPKPTTGGRNWGSIRAAEYGIPTLAKYESTVSSQTPGDTTNASNVGANGSKGKGKGGDPYASMLDALKRLSAMSQGNINSSMDSLVQTLSGQKNPYADYQAQSTPGNPMLAQLLQSQGIDQSPMQQFAAATNAQNVGQASAFQNQANTMRDIFGANQAGGMADVAQQRADLLNQLQGNVFGTGAALMGKKAPDRNSIVQMLLAAMKNRA